MSRYKFPASLPRKMYWSDEIGSHACCPDCGAPLESEHHTYMMVTRRKGSVDSYMVGNDAGHFCCTCAVAVLDREEFERFVTLAARTTDGVDYIMLGIVDLDAIPEDKRNLPFDDDTNPIPLVPFTNTGAGRSPPKVKKYSRRTKSKARKKRKRR